MSNNVESAKQKLIELTNLIRDMTDQEKGLWFSDNVFGELLEAIIDPNESKNYPNLQEFFLNNKQALTYIALLFRAISQHYSFNGVVENTKANVIMSPSYIQWFDDGVMFLQGEKPFAGILGLYQDRKLHYAIMARDLQEGEALSEEHVEFIETDSFKEQIEKQRTLTNPDSITTPLAELKTLLSSQNNNEGNYQQLFSRFPWAFGLQHKKIVRHEKLDDKNIPDFTGVRVHDGCRDIFEIKPPFAKIFRKDGTFTKSFNDAWNQCERYVDFIRQNKNYLYNEKGLNFNNPRCFLILGYNLSREQINEIRRKSRMNPSIQIMTYNDLLKFIEETISFIASFKAKQD